MFTVSTPEEMEAIGRKIALMITCPVNLWLRGPLGAGKTVFAKGVLDGIDAGEPVSSPSYLVAKEYPLGRVPTVHLDLFRINCYARFQELGLSEYLDGNWLVICEWADRIGELTKIEGIFVNFELIDIATRSLSLICKAAGPERELYKAWGADIDA